jgi:flavin-dependent dehydrogenase
MAKYYQRRMAFNLAKLGSSFSTLSNYCRNILMNLSSGYGFEFGDRGDYLQTIHSNIKDKSKIHASKCIISVEPTNAGVTVRCEDGTSYEGDIVVGADGVRSKVRDEMWRLAYTTNPALVEQDREGIISF